MSKIAVEALTHAAKRFVDRVVRNVNSKLALGPFAWNVTHRDRTGGTGTPSWFVELHNAPPGDLSTWTTQFDLAFYRGGNSGTISVDVIQRGFYNRVSNKTKRFDDSTALAEHFIEIIEVQAFEQASKKLDGGNDYGGTQASTQAYR